MHVTYSRASSTRGRQAVPQLGGTGSSGHAFPGALGSRGSSSRLVEEAPVSCAPTTGQALCVPCPQHTGNPDTPLLPVLQVRKLRLR